ncbi:MAG: hypothetical protein ABIO79_15860 [Ferruginibacter sp.]
MNLYTQITWLFLLAIPVACISWTFTHEELFREPRDYCVNRSKHDKTFFKRKFFYLFTCEYCFSHYVTILFLILTHFKLLFSEWRGYIIAGFSVVWVANLYMSIFSLIRQNIKKEITETKVLEKEAEK